MENVRAEKKPGNVWEIAGLVGFFVLIAGGFDVLLNVAERRWLAAIDARLTKMTPPTKDNSIHPIFRVVLILSRFVYLIAGLCSVYVAVVPFLSRWRPISSVTLGFWIGAVFLLMAVMPPPSKQSASLALLGSSVTIALLFCVFERVSQILTKPVLVILVISSVASLSMSALITLRSRRIEP